MLMAPEMVPVVAPVSVKVPLAIFIGPLPVMGTCQVVVEVPPVLLKVPALLNTPPVSRSTAPSVCRFHVAPDALLTVPSLLNVEPLASWGNAFGLAGLISADPVLLKATCALITPPVQLH